MVSPGTKTSIKSNLATAMWSDHKPRRLLLLEVLAVKWTHAERQILDNNAQLSLEMVDFVMSYFKAHSRTGWTITERLSNSAEFREASGRGRGGRANAQSFYQLSRINRVLKQDSKWPFPLEKATLRDSLPLPIGSCGQYFKVVYPLPSMPDGWVSGD
jgi:hypothetical protein